MRPPGSQFGNYLPVTTKRSVKEFKRTEIGDETRLRMMIQSFAILYPRTMTQSNAAYVQALAAIIEEKNLGNGHTTDKLVHLIDTQLYGVLNRRN